MDILVGFSQSPAVLTAQIAAGSPNLLADHIAGAFGNDAGIVAPRRPWPHKVRHFTEQRFHVAGIDAAGMHLDQCLAVADGRAIHFGQFEL